MRRPQILVGLLAGILVLGLAATLFVQNRPQVEDRQEPGRSCQIDPADGEVAITAAIAACPDGSTVRFPPNRQYRQAHRITVTDRVDLTIDGNGSTFTNSSDGTVTKAIDGNWVIVRGHNITIKNLTAVGSFTAYEGRPRNLGTIGTNDPAFTEAQMGIGLYGADTVHVHDVTLRNHWGDGVTTGPDEYVDGSTPDFAKNIYLKRIEVGSVGRMCFGLGSGTNVWIEDSSCSNAWYGGIDAELDNPNQPLEGLHILRNIFDGFNHLGVFVPVAGANGSTRDIEIRANRFLSLPDQRCAAPIHVGGYPDNPTPFHDVVVTENHLQHYGSGIVLDHVNGGSVTGNVFMRPFLKGSTPEGLCGTGLYDPIRITNSVNVVVAENLGA